MMINFIKGIFVGIFNIIPGLSGSALLIILNLYDKCIFSISNIFKDFRKSLLFLTPIGIGIILGTYLFSKVIFFFINNFETTTFIVFTGFVLGTIPHLFSEASKNGFKNSYIIPFFITLFIGVMLLFVKSSSISFFIGYDFFFLFKYLLIGAILSFSTVIPGISSTVLLSIFGLYGIYIYSISSFNLFVLIPILIGFLMTTFVISKIINYLLNNYYGYTYFAILGFTVSTIPALIRFDLVLDTYFVFNLFLGIIAFLITYKSFLFIKQ